MSHWVQQVNNNLINTERELLLAALADMGLSIDETVKEIDNYWGHEEVDCCLVKDGKNLSLGFKTVTNKAGEKELQLKGDFYGTTINQKDFLDNVSVNYSKNKVFNICKRNRYNINKNDIQVDESGDLVIDAYRYA